MRKIFTLLLGLATVAFVGSFECYSATTLSRHGKPATPRLRVRSAPRAQTMIDQKVMVDEDFSKFSSGSESNPVRLTYQGYYLPDNLTAQPGWVGKGIAEAGGSCAILNYESEYYGEREGYLDSPAMYLYGEVTLSFRAKVLNATSGEIWVPLCDEYDGPVDSETFRLTEQWQTFTYTTTAGTIYDCYFQFTPEDCEVLIDDIKITLLPNKVAPPSSYPIENISLTSFKASWHSQLEPDKYLFDVYSKERPAEFTQGSLTENFNDINLLNGSNEINQSDPNYPKGWTIKVSPFTEKGNNGTIALLLNKEGQEIVSPETPLPVSSLKFWVKPSNMDEEMYNFSLIQISVLNESGWSVIANLPNYWLNANGGFYDFNDEQIGEGVTKIKISYLEEGSANVAFAIDDITIGYQSADVKVPFIESKELSGDVTDYVVEGIDPVKNYYFTVRGVIGDLISKESYPQWVDGINGIKPVALPATDLSLSGFTANREPIPHATRYTLKINELTTAKEYMPDVTVLAENFDKISYGTLDNPGYDFISPFNFGENGMANSDWQATQPRWIVGMAGSAGTAWYGGAGIVVSPYLMLTNDGGAFDVEFSALSIEDDDVIFCMIIDDINASEALEAKSLQLGSATELKSTKLHFGTSTENRSNVMIAFMSKSGKMFFVDDIRISQNLQPGEALVSTYATEFLGNVTSYVLTGLSSEKDYTYSVIASTTKEFTDFVSQMSNEIRVDIASGVDPVLSDSVKVIIEGNSVSVQGISYGETVSLYDVQGRKIGVSTSTEGKCCFSDIHPGIYILSSQSFTTKIIVR